MKNNNILIIVLIVLLISAFAVIFRFSNQYGEKSLGLSRVIAQKIIDVLDSIHKLDNPTTALNITHKIVRKTAHFSLYASVWAIAMALMTLIMNKPLKYKVITSLSIGVLYAISDEIHQIFIEGRTALATDVLIDSLRSNSRYRNYHIVYKE